MIRWFLWRYSYIFSRFWNGSGCPTNESLNAVFGHDTCFSFESFLEGRHETINSIKLIKKKITLRYSKWGLLHVQDQIRKKQVFQSTICHTSEQLIVMTRINIVSYIWNENGHNLFDYESESLSKKEIELDFQGIDWFIFCSSFGVSREGHPSADKECKNNFSITG